MQLLRLNLSDSNFWAVRLLTESLDLTSETIKVTRTRVNLARFQVLMVTMFLHAAPCSIDMMYVWDSKHLWSVILTSNSLHGATPYTTAIFRKVLIKGNMDATWPQNHNDVTIKPYCSNHAQTTGQPALYGLNDCTRCEWLWRRIRCTWNSETSWSQWRVSRANLYRLNFVIVGYHVLTIEFSWWSGLQDLLICTNIVSF